MGSKRAYDEVEALNPEQETYEVEAREGSGPANKRQKTKSHNAKEGTTSWHKKRARDIERKLQRQGADLPADVKKNLERELATHKTKLESFNDKKARKEMISKYHMIRFFERKKAKRFQKQLKTRLEKATEPNELAEINADLHIATVDLNYAIYFPFMERYVSLYPPELTKKPDTDVANLAVRLLHAERPPLWSTIEKTMEEGEDALVRLQNRKPSSESRTKSAPVKASRQNSTKAQQPKPKYEKTPKDFKLAQNKSPQVKPAQDKSGQDASATGLNRRARRKKAALSGKKMEKKETSYTKDGNDGDDGDDGGFFEE